MSGLKQNADRRVEVKSPADLAVMRRAGQLLRSMREEVVENVRPGIPTLALDQIFARRASQAGVKAAFLGLYGFPGHICVSINEEVVHGIPRAERILAEGDIVSLDMGIILEGFYCDTAATAAVGAIGQTEQRLLDATRKALEAGIKNCCAGARVGDVSGAVQAQAEEAGFSVVREYTGHGIGRALHEAPQVPNYGTRGKGARLREGWVLALEPMVNVGTWQTETLVDQWTVVTKDRKPSAHFEHTVAISEDGPEVLT
jgi:methionyl aminopeptidase